MHTHNRLLRVSDYRSEHHCERALQLDQFVKAFQAIHTSYQRRGFIYPNKAGLWLTRHHLLSTTRVFLMTSKSQATGTLTLVEDSPLGLPMETLFRHQVAWHRKLYGPVAEATCLALNKCGPNAGLNIINGLMGVVAQSARGLGITQILIAVHPRHASYYTRMAGFRPISLPQPYPAVRGHLAVPLIIHLPTLSKVCPAGFDRYFSMHYPTSTVFGYPTPPTTLAQIDRLWKSIQCESRSRVTNDLPEPRMNSCAA